MDFPRPGWENITKLTMFSKLDGNCKYLSIRYALSNTLIPVSDQNALLPSLTFYPSLWSQLNLILDELHNILATKEWFKINCTIAWHRYRLLSVEINLSPQGQLKLIDLHKIDLFPCGFVGNAMNC